MALFDFPLDKLQSYKSAVTAPRDFDTFWKKTLAQTEAHPIAAKFERHDDVPFKLVDVYDVTFAGFDGHAIKGWFIEPAGNKAKLPCVVTYIGYGGGRSLPTEHLAVASMGMSHLVMDTRGQGSSWSNGATADPVGSNPQFPGFMTKGIESPETYYYRRVYTDAVRAVHAALEHPRVDARRIAVTGGSQGGGITIAAAGLLGSAVKIAMPDVPFLCDFPRATTIVDTAPYSEIVSYLKSHRLKEETVYRTLSYFDGVNFAPKIKARCLFSVGLMDNICPPSTVYAAYNRVKATKEMRVYKFNNHEGGGPLQGQERLKFLAKHL